MNALTTYEILAKLFAKDERFKQCDVTSNYEDDLVLDNPEFDWMTLTELNEADDQKIAKFLNGLVCTQAN